MNDRVVTVAEIRQAGFCAAGQRRWFEGYGIDFRKVVREGITVGELLATDDANARAVVEFVLHKDSARG